jgi:hypothetical protein
MLPHGRSIIVLVKSRENDVPNFATDGCCEVKFTVFCFFFEATRIRLAKALLFLLYANLSTDVLSMGFVS